MVFGRVESGLEIVKKIEQVGTKDGTPQAQVVIADCGVL